MVFDFINFKTGIIKIKIPNEILELKLNVDNGNKLSQIHF